MINELDNKYRYNQHFLRQFGEVLNELLVKYKNYDK
ncbi:MAG: hypothetical protein EWV48_18500 [Microcystis aeruginosa Ma_QC_C_20070823_S13]|nr:MAG: hypothetical protein EWV48_18500 [Microcystis aeruginosa Ma_QC_C_20070823_S13]TRU58095.1 MAG: hypothetical protein EWV56_15245 [Microcystis aeruginosa Ma_QC_C_20070823_S13D]